MRFSIYRGWGWVVPARMQTSCQYAYARTMPTLENSRISRVRLKKTLEISENFRVGQKNLRELQKVFEFFASLQENYLTFK